MSIYIYVCLVYQQFIRFYDPLMTKREPPLYRTVAKVVKS